MMISLHSPFAVFVMFILSAVMLKSDSQSLLPSISYNGSTVLSNTVQDIVEDSSAYPNPRNNPDACHVSKPSWLCNSDSVLVNDQVLKLERLLDSLYNASRDCPCETISCAYNGLPVVVVILRSVELQNAESLEDKRLQLQSLAGRFLKTWQFDTCDDGGVILAVASENLVVTVFGKQASMAVTVGCQEAIERNVTQDFFQNGTLYEGLVELLTQFRLVLEGDHSCNSHDILGTDRAFQMRVVIPIILILLGLIIAAIVAGILLSFRQRQSKDITTEANVPLRDQRPQTA